MEIIANLNAPTGTFQLVMTIIGALVGIGSGAVIGHYGTYFDLNKFNNFTAEEIYANPKPKRKDLPGLILCAVCFLGFAGGMVYIIVAGIVPPAKIPVVGICAAIFAAVGVFCIVSVFRALQGGDN